MSMGGSHASSTSHGSITAGGMTMSSAGHGAINILPDWLAVIWTLVFLAVFVIHVRHLLDTRGQRRLWHSGHVLMAIGMAFMFAPSSIDHLDIPRSFWQLAFAAAALVILAWMLTEALERHAINVLWVVMATDLAAMVYMWSPGGYRTPVTLLLIAYFAGQSLLWATDRMRSIDGYTLPGSFSVTAEGAAVGRAVAAPLICFRDLRLSMSAMTLGMVYMFLAIQLLM
ncbi:MAG TPA: DUF5134 domain-containing protein [Solirubrobacteraceae bacterium]